VRPCEVADIVRGLITVQTPYAGSPAAADLLAFPALADLVAKALELLIGLPPGRGVTGNKHSTDVESTTTPPPIRAFTLQVSHDPITVEWLFSMTLLLIYPEGKACSDIVRVVVLNDPAGGERQAVAGAPARPDLPAPPPGVPPALPAARPLPVWQLPQLHPIQGRGVLQNKHLTDVEPPPPPHVSSARPCEHSPCR